MSDSRPQRNTPRRQDPDFLHMKIPGRRTSKIVQQELITTSKLSENTVVSLSEIENCKDIKDVFDIKLPAENPIVSSVLVENSNSFKDAVENTLSEKIHVPILKLKRCKRKDSFKKKKNFDSVAQPASKSTEKSVVCDKVVESNVHIKDTIKNKLLEKKTSPSSRIERSKRQVAFIIKKKDSVSSELIGSQDIRIRKCEKAGCPAKRPVCFVGLSEKCAKNGYTSRWYHMSAGEHFCNECFDHCYRRSGYSLYMSWKILWDAKAKAEGSLKIFMADCMMPYWLQCQRCKKWRQVPREVMVNKDYILSFWCGVPYGKKKMISDPNACDVEQDERVAQVCEYNWLRSVSVPSLLHLSPAIPHLTSYFADQVGHSPSALYGLSDNEFQQFSAYCEPFHKPGMEQNAGAVQPDIMSEEEAFWFADYASELFFQPCYLALRNAVIAQWHLNSKETVTSQKCGLNLLCRGLIRIHYIQRLEKIVEYLTCRGFVNYGITSTPYCNVLSTDWSMVDIIVVGGGLAGLSTARQLHNFGLKVRLLENRPVLGGRLRDFALNSDCIGGVILNGACNNPIATLCRQSDIPLYPIDGECKLINEHGDLVSPDADQRIEFHLNYVLDSIDDWRKSDLQCQDTNLLDKLLHIHQLFTQESRSTFTEEEEAVLNFHIAQLEFACGTSLSRVSAKQWDHNEEFSQYGGPLCLMTDIDWHRIISLLSEGLDIELNTEVIAIDYSSNLPCVQTKDGRTLRSSRVIVSLPLGVLKTNCVSFTPALPQYKVDAIQQLGAGCIEKVTLRFSKRFWYKKINGAMCFGRVSLKTEDRGEFSVFYDLSCALSTNDNQESSFTLMTFLCGENTTLCGIQDKQAKDAIISKCLNVLRMLFPEEDVSDPVDYHISSWGSNPHFRMAYSYVPVGCNGELYDAIASPVDNKIFFVGEATNRQFPQSMTGAYVSGIYTADKILQSLMAP